MAWYSEKSSIYRVFLSVPTVFPCYTHLNQEFTLIQSFTLNMHRGTTQRTLLIDPNEVVGKKRERRVRARNKSTRKIKKVLKEGGVRHSGLASGVVYRCGRPKPNAIPCRMIVRAEGEACRHHPDVPVAEVSHLVDLALLTSLKAGGSKKVVEVIQQMQERDMRNCTTDHRRAKEHELRRLRLTLGAYYTWRALKRSPETVLALAA